MGCTGSRQDAFYGSSDSYKPLADILYAGGAGGLSHADIALDTVDNGAAPGEPGLPAALQAEAPIASPRRDSGLRLHWAVPFDSAAKHSSQASRTSSSGRTPSPTKSRHSGSASPQRSRRSNSTNQLLPVGPRNILVFNGNNELGANGMGTPLSRTRKHHSDSDLVSFGREARLAAEPQKRSDRPRQTLNWGFLKPAETIALCGSPPRRFSGISANDEDSFSLAMIHMQSTPLKPGRRKFADLNSPDKSPQLIAASPWSSEQWAASEHGEFSSIVLDMQRSCVDSRLMALDGEDFCVFRDAILSNCLCGGMVDREVLELAHGAKLYGFHPGEDVVRLGQLPTHLFVVGDGQLSLRVSSGAVHALSVGDSFGEIALAHGCRQQATVTAKTYSTCWGIKRDDFKRVMHSYVDRTHQENLKMMDSVRIFQYLDKHQKIALSLTLAVQIFPAGREIISEGVHYGDCMFILKSGTVAVEIGGTRVTTLSAGDYFGERSLLYEEPRSATVLTLEPTMVVAVSRRLLHQVLGADFEDVMWRNVIFVALRVLHAEGRVALPGGQTNLQALTSAFVIKNFPPRSDVIKEESEARGLRFVIVLNGSVVVHGPDAAGGKSLARGECLGEECLSDTSKPFQYTVENVFDEPCKLAYLSADAMAAMCVSDDDGEQLTQRQKMALVRKIYLFRHLSNHHCCLIAKSLRKIVRKRGDQVIQEGELGSQFFVINSGELTVIVKGRLVRTIGKGDYFGERGLLYDEPRTATVTCQSAEAELMVIDKAVFMHIIEKKMLQHLEERIRLQMTNVKLADLSEVRVVGRGTFGVVKLVEHKSSGTQYALKCIERAKAIKNEQRENLRLEREILLENDHPFIIKVVKTFKDVNYLYFLTELVTGGELYSTIRLIGLLTKSQAQFYAGSLMLALESLHERGIVYRDLKPENVLLDSQGFTKLIDFGCAAKVRGAAYTMIGTPHYMAPEVILSQGYSFSCDLWSLGICLYEFMCGPLPFANNTDDPMVVFREILSARLLFPPELPVDEASRDLLRQLLRRHWEKRIGCNRSVGWRQVQGHAYFNQFSFDRLLSRQLEPPLVPQGPIYAEKAEGSKDGDSSSESALSDCDSSGSGKDRDSAHDDSWDSDF